MRMPASRTAVGSIVVVVALLAGPAASEAQVRGFADLGFTRFTAADSFEAVLGSPGGTVFGGGVEVDLTRQIFVALRASQFRKDGHRVFIFDDEVFDLNVATQVTVTPVELSVGYRVDRGTRVVPYVGGGIGWHRYRESSDFAAGGEDVSESFTGYHALFGAHFRVTRLVGVAGEGTWSTVRNALGDDPNSVAAEFDEHDLGGFTARVKVVIGR
jgi:opacity protein-like surface antigen